MPNQTPPDFVPIIFQKWTPRFEALDYATSLNGPFEITTPLQAIQQEAGAKGCIVIVQISIIPAEDFYGKPEPQPEGVNPNEPQPD